MDDKDKEEIKELEHRILNIEQVVLVKVTALEESVGHLSDMMNKFVTNDRFNPVAWITYGLAAGVLTTALGAVLANVFAK